MKIKLFAAAAAVACSMAAGSALAADGTIQAAYTGISVPGLSLDGYSVAGSLSTGPVYGGWSFQGDASYLDSDVLDSSWSVQATALNRSASHAWGGYLSYSDTDFFSNSTEGGFTGQLYQSNATLSLSLGYGSADLGTSEEYLRASGGATFYFNDNLALGINGAYQNFDSLGLHNTDLGISGEWLLSQLPISIIASYNGSSIFGSQFDVYSVGVRHSFGAKSLKARDQGSVKAPVGQPFRF